MSRLSEMASDWTHLADRVRRAEKDILKLRGEVTFLLKSHNPDPPRIQTETTED